MPDYIWRYQREWLGREIELIGTEDSILFYVDGALEYGEGVIHGEEEGPNKGERAGRGAAADSSGSVRPSKASGRRAAKPTATGADSEEEGPANRGRHVEAGNNGSQGGRGEA